MKNLFVANMHLKDISNFTSDFGLLKRKQYNKYFKKACNLFTGANIIKSEGSNSFNDDLYFSSLDLGKIPLNTYNIIPGKNNIVIERYPELIDDESYIFVCNHTCPEDIETVLNILDRNAYLVLGSTETLKYNPEAYLLWLNGMIPFDIMDNDQRKGLMDKMERVIQTNSILIFPEGSHNYSPNNLINKLFDGPVNLSLKTGKKVVPITLLRDDSNSISYIDVGNPIDFKILNINREDFSSDKEYIKALSSYLRDKMATAVYHMIPRHFDELKRSSCEDLEEYLREEKINHAFETLKWNNDVFDAEYLIKKTSDDLDYEEVIRTISNLRYSEETMKTFVLDNREYILKLIDLEKKDVSKAMRSHWLAEKSKCLKKVK